MQFQSHLGFLDDAPLILERHAYAGIAVDFRDRHGNKQICFVQQAHWQWDVESSRTTRNANRPRLHVREIDDLDAISLCHRCQSSCGKDLIHGETVVASGISLTDRDVIREVFQIHNQCFHCRRARHNTFAVVWKRQIRLD